MAKCINCKTNFEQYQFNNKFCRKIDCQIEKWQWIKQQQQSKQKKEWKERKSKLKESVKTHKDYLNDLQKIFNTFIRIRDKKLGCVSCGKPFNNKYDAGHFYSVGSSCSVRFNELNVNGQCVRCNRDLHGNIHAYTERLPLKIGIDSFNELKRLRNVYNKYTINELKDLKKVYKQKIKDLESKI